MHVQIDTQPLAHGQWAHVPEPPSHDPSIPPSTPPEVPPIGPEEGDEVDLPPRESPEEIRDPSEAPRGDPPQRTQ